MKKTSLYIDPEVDRALARRAAAEGVTKAELVRRVLADAVAERPCVRVRGVFVLGWVRARKDQPVASAGCVAQTSS